MNHYTEILCELREDIGLKQSDIADLIGTTQQQYSKYETDVSELPIRVLLILADYYKISTDYILGRTECKEGVDILCKEFINNCSLGKFLSKAYSLSNKGRHSVIEYLDFQIHKENTKKNKK